MTKTSEEEVRERTLELADNKLQDAENTSVSRHTRVEACFDSIYVNLLVMAHRAGCAEPTELSTERMILAGAVAAGLDDESLGEVLVLHDAVKDLRHKPGTHPINMLHGLALSRHIAALAKR